MSGEFGVGSGEWGEMNAGVPSLPVYLVDPVILSSLFLYPFIPPAHCLPTLPSERFACRTERFQRSARNQPRPQSRSPKNAMDPLTGIRLRDATLEDVERLVSDGIPEGLHIDYKQELHLDKPKQKKEFLRDVAAFANAEGGLLVYGVEEDRDSDGQPTGVPKTVCGTPLDNPDKAVQSMENLLRDCIDERLPSYELQPLPTPGGNYVVLMRIPSSLRLPHMVTADGERRFYMRMNAGKQPMSTAQLRDAVMKTQSIEERVQAFVDDRLERLSKLGRGRPYWALHLVPLIRTAGSIDVTRDETVQVLRGMCAAIGGSPQHCLEGYMFFQYDSEGSSSHALVFRHGAIEFFDQQSASLQEPESYFSSATVHSLASRCLREGLAVYENGLLSPPLAVCLTFVGLEGYWLSESASRNSLAGPAEPISSAPVVVTDVASDPNSVLRPFMDVAWNAFGQARCSAYDDDGNYIGYRRR